MLRTIIERLSRGRSLKRRLPLRFGQTPLYVSPDAQLKYLTFGDGAFDAGLLRIIDMYIREASAVWDIGANVGVFAFGAASIASKGSTLAVEADIWLALLLRKSLLLKENRGLNIQVLPCAIADKNGAASFLIAKRGRASNFLELAGGRAETGGIRERVTVPTLTLDTLLASFDPPTFVKIDVEGAEVMVLKGAKRLLTEIRPAIYIEISRETNEAVSDILTRSGYVLFDGAKPVCEQEPVRACAYNTLALPRESMDTGR